MQYRIASHIEIDEIDGITVVSKDNGDVAVLNETAAIILACVQSSKDMNTMLEFMHNRYEASKAILEEDILKTLDTLLAHDIVVRV